LNQGFIYQMSDSIKRLHEILSEHRLRSSQDLNFLSKPMRKVLDTAIYAWFGSFRHDHINALRERGGLNLCLGWDKRVKQFQVETHLGIIVKKLIFLSNTGIIRTPKFRHPGSGSDLIPDVWYQLVLDFWELVSSGMLSILPEGVTNLEERYQLEGETFVVTNSRRVVEKTWFLLKEKIPSIKIIDLSKDKLKRQITEYRPEQAELKWPPVYIYLPHLTGLPISLLKSLRLQHGDLFALYNSTIESFFSNSAKAKTEDRLLDVMREIDEEIRKIETELEKISKSKTLQKYQITAQIGIGVLCAFLPADLAEIGMVLSGSGAAKEVFNFVKTNVDKKALLSGSAFYLPWLIHQEGLMVKGKP
jgi:hypothetical protein